VGCTNILIAVAEDCPVTTDQVPPQRCVVSAQYAMLSTARRRWTWKDSPVRLLPGARDPTDLPEEELDHLCRDFFAEPHLPARPRFRMTHGWGLHHDPEDRHPLHAEASASRR